MQTVDTVKSLLESLVNPVTWYANELPWLKDQWSLFEQSPLVKSIRFADAPPVIWQWPIGEVAIRGIASNFGGTIWFWGEPLGQEKQALFDAILIASRGHSYLSSINEDRLNTVSHSTNIAILTVPG